MACSYKMKDAAGAWQTITGKPAMMAALADGRLDHLLPAGTVAEMTAPAAAEQNAAPAPRPAPAAAPNTIFTEDAAAKARELLRLKLGQLNSGLDPEMLQAGITLAGYHIEKGARSFSAYAKAMLADLGDAVRPYLKSWYMGVKYDPRAAGFEGMDTAATVEAADENEINKEPENAPSTDGSVERNRQEPASERAVGDAVPDEGRGAGEGARDAGGQARRSGRRRQPDGAGVPADRSAAGGERGDQQLPAGNPADLLEDIAAGSRFRERGSDTGFDGVSADPIPASQVEAAAGAGAAIVPRIAQQRAAEKLTVVPGDLENIRATLPYLLPEQQEASAKAEQGTPAAPTPAATQPAADQGTPQGPEIESKGRKIVEHVTKNGKTLRGIVAADITKDQAQEIDPYTFKKDGGWFIRERHIKDDAAAPKFSRSSRPLPDTITIDGVARPTTNSNGQPIHPTEEGVRNFWQWFGGAGLVDDDGHPVPVHHGGGMEFSGIRDKGRFGKAIFVKQGSASGYGDVQHALYLRGDVFSLRDLRSALRDDEDNEALKAATQKDLSDDDADDLIRALTADEAYPEDEHVWDLIGAIDEGDAQLEIQKLRGKLALTFGASAVETPDEFDGDTIMVVEPLAIKSATGNTGTFDPATPDIRRSASADANPASGITYDTLPGAFAKRFPKLAGALEQMMARGERGHKGGLVVLDTNDEVEIAREFAERTGRSFDDTVQMFESGDGQYINAFYDPASGLTFLIGPNLTADSAPALVMHEAVHGQQRERVNAKALALIDGRAGAATPALRAFLDRVAERMDLVGEAGNTAESASYIVELAVQEGRRESGFSAAEGPMLAWIERNIGKPVADIVRDFVATVRAWALAHGVPLKSVTVDDLVAYAQAGVRKAAKGRVLTTSGGQEAMSKSPETLTQHGDVEAGGASKASKNRSRPALSGDTFYHGTAGNHMQFRSDYAGSISSGDGRGFWLTREIGYASEYALNASALRNSNPRIIRARVTFKNPMVVRANEQGKMVVDGVEKEWNNNTDAIEYALQHGYDAIDWVDGSFTDAPSVTVFDPYQIEIDETKEEKARRIFDVLGEHDGKHFSKVPSDLEELGVVKPDVEFDKDYDGYGYEINGEPSDDVFDMREDAFSAGVQAQIDALIKKWRSELSVSSASAFSDAKFSRSGTLRTATQAATSVLNKFSPSGQAALGTLTADQQTAVERVFGKPKTLAERAEAFAKDWKKNLVQGVFDQFAPIKEITSKGYMLARLAKGGDSTLEALMMYGKVSVDADGVYKVDFDGQNLKGFASAMAKLDGEHDRFLAWVSGQRAERLAGVGLENLMTPQDIAALKTLADGSTASGKVRRALYAEALRELNAFNDSVLKIAADSGLIDEATRAMYRDTPYVPFYRLSEEEVVQGPSVSKGLVNQSAWKQLKGGTSKLNEDLMGNLLKNWSHLITASANNRAAKEVLDTAARMGAATDMTNDVVAQDINGQPIYRSNTKGLVRYRGEIKRKIPKGQPYVENGQTLISDGTAEISYVGDRYFKVDDPHLMDAVASIGFTTKVWKPMADFKRYLTFGVTVNPTFKIRNLIRDSIQAVGTADLSYNPVKNILMGAKGTEMMSNVRAQMLASGGMLRFGSSEGAYSGHVRRLIEKGIDPQYILDNDSKVKAFWKHKVLPAFEAYQDLGDRSENVNRAALYEQLLAKGMSHAEASFWARDMMDFSMHGKWAAIRTLTAVVPFMNARLQGIYKLGRATKADYRRMGATLAAVSLASMALMLAYGDDDDWKKREDWDRDNSWWFKIGDTAFRIPKPFEVGAVGTIAERSLELMISDEMTGKRFGQRMRDLLMQNLSMNPTPQLIKPMIDLYANKDGFSGRDIETQGMEKLRPEDRYTARTSEVARFLGQLGLPNPAQLLMGRVEGLSPVQIDHLIRGYFAWVGTSATNVLDRGIRPLMDRGEQPDMRLRDVFLAGNFMESLPSGSSRYVTQFYEQAKEIEQMYASYRQALKEGDAEKAQGIRADNTEAFAARRRIESAKRAESLISGQMRAIERNKEMSGDEKRARLDQLEKRRDDVARRALLVPAAPGRD